MICTIAGRLIFGKFQELTYAVIQASGALPVQLVCRVVLLLIQISDLKSSMQLRYILSFLPLFP
jgi:hypothetical protein